MTRVNILGNYNYSVGKVSKPNQDNVANLGTTTKTKNFISSYFGSRNMLLKINILRIN